MCLVLIENKAQIAEKPILVFKILENIHYGFNAKNPKNVKETPFRQFRLKFIRGEATLESAIKVEYSDPTDPFSLQVINKAIHSYELLDVAEKNRHDMDPFGFWGTSVHYAIIPKGSTYYIGAECDVASNKLIIFKTKEDFEKSEYAKDYDKFAVIWDREHIL